MMAVCHHVILVMWLSLLCTLLPDTFSRRWTAQALCLNLLGTCSHPRLLQPNQLLSTGFLHLPTHVLTLRLFSHEIHCNTDRLANKLWHATTNEDIDSKQKRKEVLFINSYTWKREIIYAIFFHVPKDIRLKSYWFLSISKAKKKESCYQQKSGYYSLFLLSPNHYQTSS